MCMRVKVEWFSTARFHSLLLLLPSIAYSFRKYPKLLRSHFETIYIKSDLPRSLIRFFRGLFSALSPLPFFRASPSATLLPIVHRKHGFRRSVAEVPAAAEEMSQIIIFSKQKWLPFSCERELMLYDDFDTHTHTLYIHYTIHMHTQHINYFCGHCFWRGPARKHH